MFYVVGSKIYLAEHDGKFYPEVKLRVDSEGYFFFEKTGNGLPKKPAKKQVLSKEEIIAKMGPAVLTAAEAAENEDETPPSLKASTK